MIEEGFPAHYPFGDTIVGHREWRVAPAPGALVAVNLTRRMLEEHDRISVAPRPFKAWRPHQVVCLIVDRDLTVASLPIATRVEAMILFGDRIVPYASLAAGGHGVWRLAAFDLASVRAGELYAEMLTQLKGNPSEPCESRES